MKENKLSCLIRLNKPLNISRISMICLLSFCSFGSIQAKALGVNSTNEVQQANGTITGKVLDANGESVVGASVSLKGTTNGAITDLDGAFTLKNVSPNATLVISYLGYVTQEQKVGDKRVFSIKLQEDAQVLDEVVVQVGYGSVKRANLLGAVSNMNTEAIKDLPVSNLTEALYGKMAGVGININNGTPGNAPSISIRKVSSYTSGAQQPLFVIDGIDRGYDPSYFNMLDANDVESISVLKDASAAVYGARGAGGVILVKTKTGKEGKPRLSYSGSFGISDRTTFPELMSNEELMTFLDDAIDTKYNRNTLANMHRDRAEFRATAATDDIYYTAEEFAAVKNRNYNWLDKYWSSSTTTKHNVNLSGGTKDITYYTGLSYYQQDGNIANFNIEQYTFRVGVEAKLIAGLSGKFSLDTNTKNRRLPYNKADTSDGTMKNTFQSLMRTPYWMPYTLDGQLVAFGDGNNTLPSAKSGTVSHVGGIADSYNKGKSTNVTFNLGFAYDFSDITLLKGLKASASYSRTEAFNSGRQYRTNYNLYKLAPAFPKSKIPSETEFNYNSNGSIEIAPVDNGNRLSLSSSNSYSQQVNLGLDYGRKIGLHNLNLMLNYEEKQARGDGFDLFRAGMTIPGWEVIPAFKDARDGSNSYSRSARRGYIGRANYDYDNKYLLETSFRYEASNAFPKDSRWGFFPSASFGWRISEEDWYKLKFIDSAKLRASMGLVGDDNAISNQWRYYYESNNGGYLGGELLNGIKPSLSGVKQSNLNWEQTYYQNYGFDLRFLGKLDFGFDFWHKNTWDVLDDNTADYPTTVGVIKGPKRNYGRVRAWGYEMSLSYNGRINKDMSYTIGGNLSWSDNKVNKRIQSQGYIGTWRDQEGRRTDSGIEGYKCLGIVRTEEQLKAILDKNPNYKVFDKPIQLGMLNYEDIDNDGLITDGDLVRLKDVSSNPYAFGFNLGFKWKSLDFSAQFSGGFGGWALMNKYDYELPNSFANGLKMWNDHWTLENPNASMPRAGNSDTDVLRPSMFWVSKGTELRLRNASISYSFPKTVSTKVGMSDLRLYVTATNLFTLISPYDYKDPSLSYFDSYPIMRTINFGLNVSF